MEDTSSLWLMLLSYMFSYNLFPLEDLHTMLKECLEGEDHSKEIAETMGISIDDVKHSIESLKACINEQAEKQGVSYEEALKMLMELPAKQKVE